MERTFAGKIAFLVSLLALGHLAGPGIPGLDAQEPDRIPVHQDRADDLAPELDSLFDDWQDEIRQRMAAHDVPGLAFAVVDRERIFWTAGFGVRDRETGEPVTPETIFSVQSISKLFTATLTMRAVQDGLIELDAPVSDYLPDFAVHSRFSKRPVEKMTPRHLLQHAAGFTHEAPVGNNWDAASPSFEAHVASSRNTWLRYPVGDRYAYSNLGYDLLGYVLQKRAGTSFQDYMREALFEPLDMDASFVDRADQELCPECARGHWSLFSRLPTSIPLTASGGVRVSVEDGARFVQFHLNRGETQDGTQLVESGLLDEIHARSIVRDEDWPRDFVMGMGVFPSRKADSYSIPSHGGGFGFMASMEWFPEYGIGTVALTNSMDHPQIDDLLGLNLLLKMVKGEMVAKVDDPDVPDPEEVFPPVGEINDTDEAVPPDGSSRFRQEWAPFLGTYRPVFGGGWKLDPSADLAKSDKRHEYQVYEGDEGHLRFRKRGTDESERLIEHGPGLFFGAESGEALDFRDEPPTWRNIELMRVEETGTVAAPGRRPGRGGHRPTRLPSTWRRATSRTWSARRAAAPRRSRRIAGIRRAAASASAWWSCRPGRARPSQTPSSSCRAGPDRRPPRTPPPRPEARSGGAGT